MTKEAPWLEKAKADIGVHEVKGKAHNARILEMLREIGHPEVGNDEDSWCAVALGSWLTRAGKPTSKPVKLNRTGLSYEEYGTACEPKVGAISVSTYTAAGKKDWRRHVGLIVDVEPKRIKVLAGNQSDQVCEAWIPLSKVTATRWPPSVAAPEPLQAPKPLTQTAAESPTFGMGLSGMVLVTFGYICDGFEWMFNGFVGLLNHAPQTIGEVGPLMMQSEQIAGWAGIPWAKLSAVLVVLILGAMMLRHLWDARWLDKKPKQAATPEVPVEPMPEGAAG